MTCDSKINLFKNVQSRDTDNIEYKTQDEDKSNKNTEN